MPLMAGGDTVKDNTCTQSNNSTKSGCTMYIEQIVWKMVQELVRCLYVIQNGKMVKMFVIQKHTHRQAHKRHILAIN